MIKSLLKPAIQKVFRSINEGNSLSKTRIISRNKPFPLRNNPTIPKQDSFLLWSNLKTPKPDSFLLLNNSFIP